MSSANLLRSLRVLHLYIGVFLAPALIFFAFTGALQTFSLHETTRGSSYQPPRWAVVLGQIHKKQTSVVPERKPSPAERAGGTKEKAPAAPTPATVPAAAPVRHSLPLKIFFLTVATGLFTSTLSGIYMAYKYNRDARLVTGLLVLGAVVPVVLVFV